MNCNLKRVVGGIYGCQCKLKLPPPEDKTPLFISEVAELEYAKATVATCHFAGERRRGSRVRFPKEERCAESPPTFICGKRRENQRKPVKIKILSSGVIFMLEEGISTSCVCLEGQQPIF